MYYMHQEIYEQAKIIEKLERLIEPKMIEFRQLYLNKNPKHIILAARGSSDNACQYFRYLEEIKCGLPVSFAAPSVVTMYHANMRYQDALVIGVSQSGQAQDVIELMKHAKQQGALIISITNDLSSPMALASDLSIGLHANKELSVAATKTFTTELFVLASLVNAMTSYTLSPELNRVSKSIEETYLIEPDIERAAQLFIKTEETYVLARGLLYASAQEAALKLLEATYIHAKAYSVSDFHHGPFAAIDEDVQVIVLLEKGATYDDTLDMIKKCEYAHAKLLIFTNDETYTNRNKVIYLPQTSSSIQIFPFTVALQLFAYHVACAKGLNPDVPRGLKKVTITK